jgi:hypothetical protein
MAALAKLQARVERELTEEFFLALTASSATAEGVVDENNAATRIQAHARGWLVRQALRR